jgi:hypothetical protein
MKTKVFDHPVYWAAFHLVGRGDMSTDERGPRP